MKMLNICILDDDEKEALHNKQLLENYINQCDIAYERIDVYQTGQELLRSSKLYDLLFLDIEVGKENGIEIAKELRKRDQDIIIIVITSYVKYAMDGYKINAARYLLKPLDPSLLYSELDEVFSTSFLDQSILVKEDEKQIRLAIKDIYYFEADSRQTRFTTSAHQYVSHHNVSTWALKLPNTFVECYKGVYIHLKYIRSITKDLVILENKKTLPLARRRAELLKKEWIAYQGLIL